MKMRRRTIGLGGALAIACVLGCRDGLNSNDADAQKQPTPLIDGFVSRQKVANVEGDLRRAGQNITVLEDGANSAFQSKSRPPLSIRVVRVSHFNHWDVTGDLRLEFVDGELAATWFYPRDPARFDVEVKKRGLIVEHTRPLRLHAATELRADADYSGAKYWAWEDVHLREKVERWLKQNA